MTSDLQAQIQTLHEDVRRMTRDLAPLPQELGITLLDGETPAEGIRRAFAELRAGDGESARLLQAIREDLGALCGGIAPASTGELDCLASTDDIARAELENIRRALGMSDAHPSDLHALRGSTLDAIAALRESAASSDDQASYEAWQELEGVANELGIHERTDDLAKACRAQARRLWTTFERMIDQLEPRESETPSETVARMLSELRDEVQALRGQASTVVTYEDLLAHVRSLLGLEDDGEGRTFEEVCEIYTGAIAALRESAAGDGQVPLELAHELGVFETGDHVLQLCTLRARYLKGTVDRIVDQLEPKENETVSETVARTIRDLRESAAGDGETDEVQALRAENARLKSLLEGVVDECEPENGESIAETALRTIRDLKARAAQAKPTRGAGPRLDAVLGALGLEPSAWASAKPDVLAQQVQEIVGDLETLRRSAGSLVEVLMVLDLVPETYDPDVLAQAVRDRLRSLEPRSVEALDDETGAGIRGLLNSLCATLQIDDMGHETLNEVLIRAGDSARSLRDWGERACNCLDRMWSPLVADYPLERKDKDERHGGRNTVLVDVAEVAGAIEKVCSDEDYRCFDSVLRNGEDIRDVLGELADDWESKSDRVEKLESEVDTRPIPAEDEDLHEAAARAVYEHAHGPGSWLTADASLKYDLTRAVADALPSE